MKKNVGHLIWGCAQFVYSYQINLICITRRLEQFAKIVTVGIILRISNGVFFTSPKNLQNLVYGHLFPASMSDEGLSCLLSH